MEAARSTETFVKILWQETVILIVLVVRFPVFTQRITWDKAEVFTSGFHIITAVAWQ
jgi:hypothetical protein